ncbi:hypothetical protein EZV62_007027 [Acer yangbiense]|uniref:C2 domain-containing protein n=1 Tax=Acer yangbiense TaxID=1000413 RepID=A0A5C7IAN4_9ROSI|nr:hypothetical protein EZV62_007027 [Acer yangbiense]
MGMCLSGDVRGGKQAVGGTQGRSTEAHNNNNAGGGDVHDDAVDFFFDLVVSKLSLLELRIDSYLRKNGCQRLVSLLKMFNPHFITVDKGGILSLSASKLRDRDITSKSDPMAVVYAKKREGTLEEIGRTEVITNSLNPTWIVKIFCMSHNQCFALMFSHFFCFSFLPFFPFRSFHVYDVDTKYHNVPVKMLKLNEQDFLGEASCFLSEIVTKQNRTSTLNLHDKRTGVSRNLGTLSVHAEETVASRSAVEISFHCSHLANVDLFSKSDPFLRISRIVESGDSVPICKTELINDNLNPNWRPITLSMQQCGSKLITFSLMRENPLIIECFDFNTSGNHVLLGKIQKSMVDLQKLHQEQSGANFVLPSAHHNHEKVLKSQMFVDKYIEKEQYTFLDYISSGFELNFMVAVDFTASNGNPQNPNSLHYIDPSGRLNSYQQTIMEVGEVIQFYDFDRRFPAWGFGGNPFNGTVSHCFNLNGLPNGSEVEGVDGIMAAYASALHNVSLAGPTLFGPVINMAAEIASQSLSHDDRSKYFVLLIITVSRIIISITLIFPSFILLVGGADFTQMEILDADNGCQLESSTGGRISAVQALLEELPGQFLSYVRARDIKPRYLQVA